MSAAATLVRAQSLELHRLGRIAYDEAMRVHDRLLEQRLESGEGGHLLVLEHEPVYTLGRGADEADLQGAPGRLGVPVYRVGRGGGATFHGPGQAVVYPIVGLPGHGRDVARYVRMLETALVDVCAMHGVAASPREGETGVWTESGKIGAIGIGVRRGVAFHGVALNVSNRTDYFEQIVPCRAPGMAVTTLEREGDPAGSAPEVAAVGDAIASSIADLLGCEVDG